MLLALLELVVPQVPQVLVLRELQGPLALPELAGLPEQLVRAYLVPLVPLVQEYLALRELRGQELVEQQVLQVLE